MYMDKLNGKRFTDRKTGNSLLFTFEDEDSLVIDLDSKGLDPDFQPDEGIHLPLKSIYLNIRTGKAILDSW